MSKVEIYTWQYCPFCIRAKALLDQKGINYQEYSIDGYQEARSRMIDRANGRKTVPQIFINNEGIGGCEELHSLESANQLDKLIKQDK